MMFQKYDYTRTLMLKLDLAIPDPEMGCKVMCTFDQALEIVKQIDRMTPGYTKVLYLVGWQYNGHDDRYPEFFEVNGQLKSPGDATARDSLLRLVEEAQKYNTVISYHINISDAYQESALWPEYMANDLILLGRTQCLSGPPGTGVGERVLSKAGGPPAGAAPHRGGGDSAYRRVLCPQGAAYPHRAGKGGPPEDDRVLQQPRRRGDE